MDRCEAPFAADLTIHRKDTKNDEARDDYGRWGLMAKVRETPSFVWTSPEGLFGEKPLARPGTGVTCLATQTVGRTSYPALTVFRHDGIQWVPLQSSSYGPRTDVASAVVVKGRHWS